MKEKNKFVEKAKGKWLKIQQDPFANAKFNYKVTRIFTYGIMLIISVMFIRLIYTQFKTPSMYGSLIGGFMIVIFIYMLYSIYSKVLLPQKKIISHYENSPTNISTKHVDVEKEINEILSNFDVNGKRKNAK